MSEGIEFGFGRTSIPNVQMFISELSLKIVKARLMVNSTLEKLKTSDIKDGEAVLGNLLNLIHSVLVDLHAENEELEIEKQEQKKK